MPSGNLHIWWGNRIPWEQHCPVDPKPDPFYRCIGTTLPNSAPIATKSQIQIHLHFISINQIMHSVLLFILDVDDA